MSRQWTSDASWHSIPDEMKKNDRSRVLWALYQMGESSSDHRLAEFMGEVEA